MASSGGPYDVPPSAGSGSGAAPRGAEPRPSILDKLTAAGYWLALQWALMWRFKPPPDEIRYVRVYLDGYLVFSGRMRDGHVFDLARRRPIAVYLETPRGDTIILARGGERH